MVRGARLESRGGERKTRRKDSLGEPLMNINQFEIKKTGILFFDILNGYYHSGNSAAEARMKPWVDNAVRLMKAARAANIPIFFAKGNHRPDNTTSALHLTDTNNGLQPWPNG